MQQREREFDPVMAFDLRQEGKGIYIYNTHMDGQLIINFLRKKSK